jgi:hypothetical protein
MAVAGRVRQKTIADGRLEHGVHVGIRKCVARDGVRDDCRAHAQTADPCPAILRQGAQVRPAQNAIHIMLDRAHRRAGSSVPAGAPENQLDMDVAQDRSAAIRQGALRRRREENRRRGSVFQELEAWSRPPGAQPAVPRQSMTAILQVLQQPHDTSPLL